MIRCRQSARDSGAHAGAARSVAFGAGYPQPCGNPNPDHGDRGGGGDEMKVSYRVAMAQELLRLLAEAQEAHSADCQRLRALVAKQVAELLA